MLRILIILAVCFAPQSFATSQQGLVASEETKVSAFDLGFFAIPVLDIGKAKAFYGPVMGWSFNPRDPNFEYIFANDNMIGSLETASATLKPSQFGPLIYFRADCMQKTLDRVVSNGGKVLEKLAMDGGKRGYTARVEDPFKNVIGFWAPEE